MARLHFREAGKKLQVLAYGGYDKERKKAIVEMIGAIDYSTMVFEPSEKVKSGLTVIKDEDMKQIEKEIEMMTEFERRAVKERAVERVGNVLKDAVEAVKAYGTDVMNTAQATEIYNQIQELTKEMRRCGYTVKNLLKDTGKTVKEKAKNQDKESAPETVNEPEEF